MTKNFCDICDSLIVEANKEEIVSMVPTAAQKLDDNYAKLSAVFELCFYWKHYYGDSVKVAPPQLCTACRKSAAEKLFNKIIL